MKRLFFFVSFAAVLNLSALTVVLPDKPDNAEKLAFAELQEVLEKDLEEICQNNIFS